MGIFTPFKIGDDPLQRTHVGETTTRIQGVSPAERAIGGRGIAERVHGTLMEWIHEWSIGTGIPFSGMGGA